MLRMCLHFELTGNFSVPTPKSNEIQRNPLNHISQIKPAIPFDIELKFS